MKKISNFLYEDFIIENKVLIEIKAVEEMPIKYEKQLIRYLRGAGYELGFLVNFGGSRIDIRRRVNQRKSVSEISENL